MDIEIQWQRELPLKYNSKNDAYELDLDSIPEVPGIYVFGRRFNGSFEALYVGKGKTLRSRIKTQLNNHKLLTHIWDAKSGNRIVKLGAFKAKSNQTSPICLPIAERALIRYFVSEGHNLANIQGKKIKHHNISSTGTHKSKDFPNRIEVE